MDKLTLPAPAKLNLFLHILGRRRDGYHNLQTLFQLLDYGDELHFRRRNDQYIQLNTNLSQCNASDNLVFRAAQRLQQRCSVALGADITLQKRLPLGGGLGGGSSDAATTLLALNQLWQCGLGPQQLSQLGRELGADVPVFVRGRSAWAEGIGDEFQAIDLPEFYYLVLTPKCEVSTTTIFQHPELTRDSAAITVAAFFEQGGRNDCQALVQRLYPAVDQVIQWLRQHLGQNRTVRMTGSGASVFAAFESEQEAKALLAQSPWSGFVAKGINQSPVHRRLEDFSGNLSSLCGK